MNRITALLVAFALCLAPALGGAATTPESKLWDKEKGWTQSAFGERGIFELVNVISIQSVWGTSTIRDVIETTGTGGTQLDGGYVEVSTGTTTGSSARVETVQRGQYQPGKSAEGGVGIYPKTAPDSGTESMSWGLGDGNQGVFWRYHDSDSDGDFELCVVYEKSTVEDETCEGDFNGFGFGEWDPATDAGVYVVRFNWYGVGERIPLIRNDPTCAIGYTDSGTGSVDFTLRVQEGW
jgi:hypothetical protein